MKARSPSSKRKSKFLVKALKFVQPPPDGSDGERCHWCGGRIVDPGDGQWPHCEDCRGVCQNGKHCQVGVSV